MAKGGVRVHVYGDYDAKDIKRAIKDLEKLQASSDTVANRFKAMGDRVQKVGKSLTEVGAGLTVGLTAPIIAGGAALLAFGKEAEEAAISNRKLGAVLDSMGYPQATQRVSDYAEQLERSLAVDADVIRATQTKLATFKNLTATVGEAGGAFDRATMAALDLAAAGFGQAETNAVQLGKALQDPVKGITALARAGVTFTEQEKEKIKALVESGDILAAQNIILSSIEGQVGGTAEAGASGFERIRLSLLQVGEAIGQAVLPLIEQFADFISNRFVPEILPRIEALVQKFTDLSPRVKAIIGVAAAAAAALGPLLIVAGQLTSAAGALMKALGGITVAGSLLAIKVVAVVAAVVAVALAFKAMYDRSESLRDAVSALIGTVKNIATTLLGDLLGAFRSVTGEAGDLRSIFDRVATIAGNVLAGALRVLTGWWNILANSVRVVIKVYEVAFKIFDMTANLIKGAVLAAIDILLNKLGPVSAAFRNFAEGVKRGFTIAVEAVRAAIRNVGPAIESFINFGIRAINKLIDAYNTLAGFLPGMTRATHIAEFSFKDMTAAANTSARATYNAASGMSMTAAEALRAENNAGRLATSLDDVNASATATATGLGGGGGVSEAAKRAAEKQEQLKKRTDELRDALKKAIEEARNYAVSIAETFVGQLDLGAALQAAKESGKSIVDEFVAQGKRLAKFTENMNKLLAAGLNRTAFDQIIRAGAERGADIANALADGNINENIANVNRVYTSVQTMGNQVGAQASSTFLNQGIILAQTMLTAFIREFMPAGKKRRELLSAIESMVNDANSAMNRIVGVSAPAIVTPAAAVAESVSSAAALPFFNPYNPMGSAPDLSALAGINFMPFAEGGLVKGPTLGLVGEAGPELIVPLDRAGKMGSTTINLTVNAGMGTNGAEVGRQIVDALKAYERRNGPVYASA